LTSKGADGLARARVVLLMAWGLALGALLVVVLGGTARGGAAGADSRPALIRTLGLTDLALEPSGTGGRAAAVTPRGGPG